jgi:hypothetical protein
VRRGRTSRASARSSLSTSLEFSGSTAATNTGAANDIPLIDSARAAQRTDRESAPSDSTRRQEIERRGRIRRIRKIWSQSYGWSSRRVYRPCVFASARRPRQSALHAHATRPCRRIPKPSSPRHARSHRNISSLTAARVASIVIGRTMPDGISLPEGMTPMPAGARKLNLRTPPSGN